jgi:hypothetical protein
MTKVKDASMPRSSRRIVPDLASRRVFACGPNDFVEAARVADGTAARGFDSEAFTAPRIADDSDNSGSVQVTLAAQPARADLAARQSLLDALEAAGLTPAHPVAAWASAIPAPAASARAAPGTCTPACSNTSR